MACACDSYYTKFWDKNVIEKSGHQAKWAEYKDRPMARVVENVTVLKNQCELWGSRCKSAHEDSDAVAIDTYKAEVVLLFRLMELCNYLLMGEDRHPENLKKDDKKRLLEFCTWAADRLEHSKPRLKRSVMKMFKEKLRRHAAKLENKAKAGDADAQYNLAICYDEGKGTAKDEKQAAHWYAKAAEQDDADAPFSLGVCHPRGQGRGIG